MKFAKLFYNKNSWRLKKHITSLNSSIKAYQTFYETSYRKKLYIETNYSSYHAVFMLVYELRKRLLRTCCDKLICFRLKQDVYLKISLSVFMILHWYDYSVAVLRYSMWIINLPLKYMWTNQQKTAGGSCLVQIRGTVNLVLFYLPVSLRNTSDNKW